MSNNDNTPKEQKKKPTKLIKSTHSVDQSKVDKKLETFGVNYFNALSIKLNKRKDPKHIYPPSDSTIKKQTARITRNAVFFSFLAGAITTTPAVIFEIYYQQDFPPIHYYFWLGFIITLMLVLELGYLYWLAIKSVHEITHMLGYQETEHDPLLPSAYAIPNLMSRAALELPDPVVKHLSIDPNAYISKKKLLFLGLLYKAKIMLTSLILKIILRKVATRFGVRMGFVWITIPVTAIWDAYVTYKVINDAKVRLFGYSLATYVIHDVLTTERLHQFSPLAQEGTLRVFATIIVLAGNYHPNNMMIIMRLSKILDVEEKHDYADWQYLLRILDQVSEEERECLHILLCIAAAFDGKLSKMERLHLPEAFGEKNKSYMAFIKQLSTMIMRGELHAVTQVCKDRMFNQEEMTDDITATRDNTKQDTP